MGRANNERMRTPPQQRADVTRVASRADQDAVRSRQDKMGKVAELAASFGPTGDLMAAKDAVVEGRKGNWGKAALAAASMVPGVGAIGDAARGADKARDIAKVAAEADDGLAAIKSALYQVIDTHTGKVVRKEIKGSSAARLAADRLDNKYGGYRYVAKMIRKGD